MVACKVRENILPCSFKCPKNALLRLKFYHFGSKNYNFRLIKMNI